MMAKTQEEKKREQQEAVIAKSAPVGAEMGLPQTQKATTPAATTQDGYNGILDRIERRRQEAYANAVQANKRWRQAYEQTGDIMSSFVPKPVDTTNEQKRLRRSAIAQAFGELVGTIGQGIVATGRGGEGYVTAPLGMYNNTIQQLQRLKDQDIADRKDYENLMARLRMQQRSDLNRLYEKEADRANAEVNAYDKMLTEYGVLKEKQRIAAQEKAEERAHQAEQNRLNRENTIKAAEIRAANSKKSGKVADDLTDAEKRILYTILPKERTVTRTDEDGKTYTTTQPYSKYPEEQVASMVSVAKGFSRLGINPSEVESIMELIRQYDSIKEVGDENYDISNILLGLKSGRTIGYLKGALQTAIKDIKAKKTAETKTK